MPDATPDTPDDILTKRFADFPPEERQKLRDCYTRYGVNPYDPKLAALTDEILYFSRDLAIALKYQGAPIKASTLTNLLRFCADLISVVAAMKWGPEVENEFAPEED